MAPTASNRTWLDRVLRPRLEGILAELGAREARLLLAVAEDRPTGTAPPCDRRGGEAGCVAVHPAEGLAVAGPASIDGREAAGRPMRTGLPLFGPRYRPRG